MLQGTSDHLHHAIWWSTTQEMMTNVGRKFSAAHVKRICSLDEHLRPRLCPRLRPRLKITPTSSRPYKDGFHSGRLFADPVGEDATRHRIIRVLQTEAEIGTTEIRRALRMRVAQRQPPALRRRAVIGERLACSRDRALRRAIAGRSYISSLNLPDHYHYRSTGMTTL